MRSTERHYDALRGDHYHILKVHVILPLSPTDYLHSASISNLDHLNRRRLGGGSEPFKKYQLDDLWNMMSTDSSNCPLFQQNAALPATEGVAENKEAERRAQDMVNKGTAPGNPNNAELAMTPMMDTTLCRKFKLDSNVDNGKGGKRFAKMEVTVGMKLKADIGIKFNWDWRNIKVDGWKTARCATKGGFIPYVNKAYCMYDSGAVSSPTYIKVRFVMVSL